MPQIRVLVVAVACAALVFLIAVGKQQGATTTDRSTSGELVRCQFPSRKLTLLTEEGEWSFAVADNVIVHEGAKTLALADVCASVGQRIKVWYRESRMTRTVHDIRMSSRSMPAHGAAAVESDDARAPLREPC